MKTKEHGFTLIEVVVAAGILAILAIAIYGTYASILQGINFYRERTTVSALADQYLEVARNLPYSKIGTTNGNPSGQLPDQPNALNYTFNGQTYKIYYVVNYIDDMADGLFPQDTAPNDYKQVKLYIKNTKTNSLSSFVTNISPQNLEGLASGGALSLKVFNAVGQPLSNATLHITNTSLNPHLDLTRMTDSSGNWIEVGLPNSINSYHIIASKLGYSTDQTYPAASPVANPTKPDSTISNGQVTQVSFSIDQTSNLVFNTLNQNCQPISGVSVLVQGAKLIGTNPNVLKFNNNYTSNANGQINLSGIEWDNYTPTIASSSYIIYGSSPIQQVSLLPNTIQNFNLILGPKTTNSLLVIVKDSSTGNAIEGATVNLQKLSPVTDNAKITGGSLWSQQSWQNFSDSSNIDNTNVLGGIRLAKSNGNYASSGYLVSSTFDTGTNATNYTTLAWQPTSQDPSTTLKLQVATNNDNQTWDFTGPDGTSSTFYTVPGTTISSANNGNRYIRFKVYLATTDSSKTPVLTSVNVNYVSGCFTPGQAMFEGLLSGSGNYQLVVSMSGYQTQTISGLNIQGNQTLQILLSHQ